jgi:hypothetical protein
MVEEMRREGELPGSLENDLVGEVVDALTPELTRDPRPCTVLGHQVPGLAFRVPEVKALGALAAVLPASQPDACSPCDASAAARLTMAVRSPDS